MRFALVYLSCCCFCTFQLQAQKDFKSVDGRVIFTSSKDINVLTAYSENLFTKVIPASGAFTFKVQVSSFNFSNCSRLVEKLFNDVYMESNKFHWAHFEGTIIETIDFTKPGEYLVTVKGNLNIHGVSRERSIAGKITVRENGYIGIESEFPVVLSDHQITILPEDISRLADTIKVQVSSALQISY